MKLTDAQWEILAPLLPRPIVRKDGKGRPWRNPRDVLSGILWILRSGARWKDLPTEYPPYPTCHRRFQAWVRNGTLKRLLRALAKDLEERGGIDLAECFIDGTFSGAKKGGSASGKPSAAKGPRSWQSQTAMVFLSPFASTAIGRTKLPSPRKLSMHLLSMVDLPDLLATKPTTAIHSTDDSDENDKLS